jgi:serine/threonine protein kinase
MDPDIVKKIPYAGPAADIWACGVILYIIYVGKLPFFGEFEADLFRKIQNAKFKEVPSELGDHTIRALFVQIFQPQAKLRITAEGLLEHHWLSAS